MKKILSTATIIACLSSAAFGGSYTHNDDDSSNAYAGSIAGASGGDAIQGQRQGQIGVNASDIDVKNKSNVEGSGNSESTAKQKQDASSTNKFSIGNGDKIAAKIPVARAYAPVVISTSDCLGSVSAGGQGQFFGLTFGGTTQSKPCNVRAFASMNAADVELYYTILCQDPIMEEAYKVRGTYNRYCVGAKAKTGSKWFGLGSTMAYEDACAYPNSGACTAFKRAN